MMMRVTIDARRKRGGMRGVAPWLAFVKAKQNKKKDNTYVTL